MLAFLPASCLFSLKRMCLVHKGLKLYIKCRGFSTVIRDADARDPVIPGDPPHNCGDDCTRHTAEGHRINNTRCSLLDQVNALADAQEEYMPSGPPISPLTTS